MKEEHSTPVAVKSIRVDDVESRLAARGRSRRAATAEARSRRQLDAAEVRLAEDVNAGVVPCDFGPLDSEEA